MRKAQKQQAEEFAKLLDRAHNEIRKAIDRKDPGTARELLEQCQEGAIELGNMIEEEEGEGFITVSLLETYCELVYQIHETILYGAAVNGGRIQKRLRRLLVQIENSIRNDIKTRQEIVFLPYKASMWDSLESVWKAAEEDPNCDAYVIPIPYYDKNPDGSFREMHYEGELYPDYVPVTWYEDYDFAERRPDRIFIHNPYDECNYVTSVHPFFYAKNLKQFTETLVYIPYFILSEIEPENKEAVRSMAHFCTVPGVIYADKVIVQSEKMRQVYVDVMTEFTAKGISEGREGRGISKENVREAGRRKYWEEKILGLGSPKVDKVLNTKKEDLEIPGEWLQVIEKPDGIRKKVVFYNTSVTALLEHGEKMLLKMRDVFRVFAENKEEVALLWRPHPLIRATIESMRPKLWEEYQEIVREYQAAGWGIYDDTADVDRAMVLSDGYYGDGSSLAWLSDKAEKLVMIQNPNVMNHIIDRKSNLFQIVINDAVEVDDKIWFFSTNFKSIFSLDTKSNEIECYRMGANGLYSISGAFSSMSRIHNKIYLVPLYERAIFCFDMEKREFKKIELECKYTDTDKALFMGVRNYKDYLFIMGSQFPVIIRLDTKDDSMEYITDWEKDIERYIFDRNDAYFRQQCVILDNKLFVPFCNANAVLELNCDNLSTKIHVIGLDVQGYSGISFDGESFWLSPRKSGSLVKWNAEKETKDYFKIGERNLQSERLSYAGIACCDGEKLLFPFQEEEIHGIQSQKISVLKGEYSFCQENNNSIIFYEVGESTLVKINKSTHETLSVPIRVELKDIDFCMDIKKEKQLMVIEGNGTGLVELVKMLENSIDKPLWINDPNMWGKESCGYSIFTM